MIDTHLHLWQLDAGWYGWNTPDLGDTHADSSLADIGSAQAEAGVTATVVVQAADTLEETDWLLDLAAREPAVAGVVGYLPLDDETLVEELIATYTGSALVGVRQLWHDHDHPHELADDDTVRGLLLLGEAGLPVDVPDAFPDLWPALSSAVRRAPGTTFVLDHCGKPPFGDQVAWTAWEHGFRELARHPNVIVKLSGLFGGRGAGHAATDTELARVVELTRTTAGAARTMIGSDWPMTRGRFGYVDTMTRLDGLLSGWTDAERELALAGTAMITYAIPPAT